jgi:hypothetical protein
VSLYVQVLGVERVGIDDDFFALGGHSLLATQLLARAQDALQLQIPVATLFTAPTVRALDAALDALAGKAGSVPPPIAPASRPAAGVPLSWAEERMWVLHRLEGAGASYNMPGAMRIEGEIRVELLEAALARVLARHESLRTRFGSGDKGPVQIIEPRVELRVQVEDLSGLDVQIQARQVEARAREEAARPFDLETCPLLRVHLLRLGERAGVLVLVLHHIVCDGWSLGVLFRELATFYQALCEGREVELPALPIQYADFALAPARSLGHAPLFQVLFALQNAPMPTIALPGLRLTPITPEASTARFDLALSLEPNGDELRAQWSFASDLFDRDWVLRLAEHYDALLQAVLAEPKQPLSRLPLPTGDRDASATGGWPTLYPLPGEGQGPVSALVTDAAGRALPLGIEGEIRVGPGTVGAAPDPARLTPTDLWGRRRWPDGALEPLGLVARLGICAGRRTNAQALERALLERPEVEACRVLCRGERRIAYAVLRGPVQDAALARLREGLPDGLRPELVLPVTALPLTSEGRIDDGALSALPLLDRALAERWERALETLPEVVEAAVVVDAVVPTPPLPWHLEEILPAACLRRADEASPARSDGAPAAETAPEPTHEALPAISSGGLLAPPGDAPQTLTQLLIGAVEARPQQRIAHLDSRGDEQVETYAALLKRARRLAAGLATEGIGEGDRVMLVLDQARDFLPAFWACVLRGAVPLPVAADPGQSARVQGLCNATRPSLALVDRALRHTWGSRTPACCPSRRCRPTGRPTSQRQGRQAHKLSPC